MKVLVDNSVFFQELLARINMEGLSTRIVAKGNSMLPLVRNQRDELLLSPLTDQSIKKGNILLAQIDGRYIVHRIEKINGDKVTLRGDGNPYQREQCSQKDLLAEMTVVFRDGKKEIHKGSFCWTFVRFLWFRNPFLRRIALFIIRRL